MNQGLAHIVGRMIDSTATTNDGTAMDNSIVFQDDSTGTQRNTLERTHIQPDMMRYMGIGTGAQINSETSPITNTEGKGEEWCLENESTNGPFPMYGIDLKTGAAAGITTPHGASNASDITANQETVDNFPGSDSITTFTHTGRVDMSVYAQRYDASGLTFLGQGEVGSNTLLSKETAGTTAEGTYFTSSAGTTPRTTATGGGVFTVPSTNATTSNHFKKNFYVPFNNAANKKQGKKLIYVAVFPPMTPSNTDQLAITEAGIFNGMSPGKTRTSGTNTYTPGSTNVIQEQTMLCRTQFAVVTKQPADTLQITWTIEFSDNTPANP